MADNCVFCDRSSSKNESFENSDSLDRDSGQISDGGYVLIILSAMCRVWVLSESESVSRSWSLRSVLSQLCERSTATTL